MSDNISYNTNTSWFIFDKIYNNIGDMNAETDGIMLGRYVYSKENSTIYRKEYNGTNFYYNEIFNLKNITTSSSGGININIIENINNLPKVAEDGDIYIVTDNKNTSHMVYIYCNGYWYPMDNNSKNTQWDNF